MYTPTPIDVSGVVVPLKLEELIETLARNNHDIWARQRIAEGWTLGLRRDDTRKTHPLLVPYEDLPELEKDYDRNTAIGTLKAVIAAGYRIDRAG
jgi:hypothetical protein